MRWSPRSGPTPGRPSRNLRCRRTSRICDDGSTRTASRALRTTTIERVGPGYTLRIAENAVDAWRFEDLISAAAAAGEAKPSPMLTEALALWRGAPLAGFADEEWAKPTAERWTAIARRRPWNGSSRHASTMGESAVLVPELESFVAQAPLREERWRLLVAGAVPARTGRPMRSPRCAGCATCWPTSWVSTPAPALRSLEARSSARTQSRQPRRVTAAAPRARHAASPVAPAEEPTASTTSDNVADEAAAAPPAPRARRRGHASVERDGELRGSSTGACGTAALAVTAGRADRGPGRHRQDPPAARDPVDRRRMTPQCSMRAAASWKRNTVSVLFGNCSNRRCRLRGSSRQLFAGAAGAARWVFAAQQDTGTVTPATPRSACCTVSTGWPPISRRQRPWSSPSTTCSGAMSARCDSSGSWRIDSRNSRSPWWSPCAPASTTTNEDLLAEIVSEASVLVVAPQPLSDAGVNELVRERLGEYPDDAFVAACRRTTGGNPLLLRQLLQGPGIRRDQADVRPMWTPSGPSGPERSPAWCCADSPACHPRIVPSPELSPSSATAQRCRWSPELTASAGRRGGVERSARWPGPKCSGTSTRSTSCTHWSATPCTAMSRWASGKCSTPRPPGCWPTPARRPSRSPRICSRSRPAATRGTVDVLLTAAARSVARGAPDGAVTYLKRALAEPASCRPGSRSIYLELGRVGDDDRHPRGP